MLREISKLLARRINITTPQGTMYKNGYNHITCTAAEMRQSVAGYSGNFTRQNHSRICEGNVKREKSSDVLGPIDGTLERELWSIDGECLQRKRMSIVR